MKKETWYFAEYLYHGLLFSESSRKRIDSTDPFKVKREKGAYGFNLLEQEVVIDGEDKFEGKAKYLPGQYFFEGQVFTLDEVKKQMPKEETLIWNMEHNDYKKVIKVGGRIYPFNKECVLLG